MRLLGCDGVSALAVAGGNPVCLDEGRASFRGVQIGAHRPGTILRAEAEGVPRAEVEVLVHVPVPVAVVGASGSEQPQGSLAQRLHQQHQTNRENQPQGAGDGAPGGSAPDRQAPPHPVQAQPREEGTAVQAEPLPLAAGGEQQAGNGPPVEPIDEEQEGQPEPDRDEEMGDAWDAGPGPGMGEHSGAGDMLVGQAGKAGPDLPAQPLAPSQSSAQAQLAPLRPPPGHLPPPDGARSWTQGDAGAPASGASGSRRPDEACAALLPAGLPVHPFALK